MIKNASPVMQYSTPRVYMRAFVVVETYVADTSA